MMIGARLLLFVVALAISCPPLVRSSTAQSTDPSEVEALRAIKSNLVDPFSNLNSWNSGDPCTSNWTGIICQSTTNDGYLHVHELLLLNSNLSGTLAPEVGLLSRLEILDFMWNNISGSIPKEIGNITSLKLLLLNGNRLSGFLPKEIGFLLNLNRIQIDENQISGPIPTSFANLKSMKHFHMNNNSLSGPIPPELSGLSSVFHLLLDNNKLSGHIPPELAKMPSLQILQLDNNNFSGSTVPTPFANMTSLLKLSLRNCSLRGAVPDLSMIPQLIYLDLSWNQLEGTIPSNKLSENVTTIDLSNNNLNGPIPSNFSHLPKLQRLSLENNKLNGSVPSAIWQNMPLYGNKSVLLDFQNNSLTELSAAFSIPENVTVLLYGNPVCSGQINISNLCQPVNKSSALGSSPNSNSSCGCNTDLGYEFNQLSPSTCSCSIPFGIGIRLKSPGISYFHPYKDDFEVFLTNRLNLYRDQLYVDSDIWEDRRLKMYLKLFPSNTSLFNESEILRIRDIYSSWEITLPGIFGPYELLNFTLGPYANVITTTAASGLSTIAIVGIVLGACLGAAFISATVTVFIMRKLPRNQKGSKRRLLSSSIKIDGVKGFAFEEMALATSNFNSSTQVGEGGYGKVYKGVLADGSLVAIKRAQEGSLQGSKEFFTEIQLLSRVHHRNLVSLVGYCIEEGEQMLVYEFIPNGTLRDHLAGKSKEPMNFSVRLRVALAAAKGILYLHTEADPPIFHRDIKASNILLDSKLVAKVADFGLSRLAPVPDFEGATPDYVSTVVKGTPGYLDPEYFLTHKLTDKSDVYSLGVVFLELLTAMKPISHGKNIVREVNSAYQSGDIFSIIDSRMGAYPSECVGKFVSLALKCCQDETDMRPSMSEVVRELEVIWRMTPEIDAISTDSVVTESLDTNTTPSSSSVTGNPFSTLDFSGNSFSNLYPR
ncbi:Non-specific serine/threonine protein kinase protein [Dioscorea alata]|uniref:Non-specific serine/threonine protein kinase protein n=3 Tax=Dioscorea alata TaxID=55571 RepID=A0ACB7VFG8_DIOAL|nr:Non-specific serine/threonine protein kinase protein [Dioscorea alata]KAH7672442.1 Non-specific serine/threonine protein kinase protein [Dioscorea alata]